jgi:hypothetical protein
MKYNTSIESGELNKDKMEKIRESLAISNWSKVGGKK